MDEVLCDDRDGIRIITINRAQARNAIDLAVAHQLATALDELDDRPDLRIAILTGAGGGFCAGMDLKAFSRAEDPIIPGRGFGGFTERPPDKPLIAAVEGFALGGGFELVLACDLVVSANDARFGMPEVTRGLLAAAGGLLRLPQRLPHNVAMEMALTGQPILARRAYDLGLVNRLAEPGQALHAALELAAQIALNSPIAVSVSKHIVTESIDWPTADAFEFQRPFAERIADSDDAREGALAFLEKRTPRWTGR